MIFAAANADSRRAECAASTTMKARRWAGVGWLVTLAWALNLALLTAACSWVALDGQFMEPITVDGRDSSTVAALLIVAPMSAGRMQALWALIGGIATTIFVMACGLIVGRQRHRRIAAWLSFTAVVALWLTLWIAWPELAWAGQRWRVRRMIGEFEPVALSLRRDWPIADDVTEELGPFSAYPNGRPRILMPLLKPSARGNHAPFSVVERSPQGALRFELLGNNAGAWLEWHPGNSRPASFIGGLETEYALHRASPLADGWYLTRYQAKGLASL